MGCGTSTTIVGVCGSSSNFIPLRRQFSRHGLQNTARIEEGYDDIFLIRNDKLLSISRLHGGGDGTEDDEDNLSDITANFSAKNSVSGVISGGSFVLKTDDLERRRYEAPISIEEDLFVYDDAIISKNETQEKHWRIEGRRPPLSSSRRLTNYMNSNNKCTQELFSFTDFNVCVDEVDVNMNRNMDKEIGQWMCFSRGLQRTLLGAKVTRTFSTSPNTVASQCTYTQQQDGQQQQQHEGGGGGGGGGQFINYHPLNHFTINTIIGHSARIKCISILPNGRSFVSCSSEDASVVMRNIKTGQGEGIFTGHRDTIICTAISPDGKYLATTSKDCSMTLWDAIITKMLYILHHDKVVICCCFSPDGKTVVSGCQDRICRVWDLRNVRELLSYNQHCGIIVSMTFSPGGNNICSTSADRTLHVWSSTTGKTQLKLTGHSGIVLACNYTPNGEYIISNDETYLCVWLAHDGTCKIRLAVTDFSGSYIHNTQCGTKLGWTTSCAAPGVFGHYVVVASTNRFVYIFDIRDGKEYSHVFCKAPVYCLTSGAKNKIVFGDSFGNIYVQTLS